MPGGGARAAAGLGHLPLTGKACCQHGHASGEKRARRLATANTFFNLHRLCAHLARRLAMRADESGVERPVCVGIEVVTHIRSPYSPLFRVSIRKWSLRARSRLQRGILPGLPRRRKGMGTFLRRDAVPLHSEAHRRRSRRELVGQEREQIRGPLAAEVIEHHRPRLSDENACQREISLDDFAVLELPPVDRLGELLELRKAEFDRP
jgi:hypothetical protein